MTSYLMKKTAEDCLCVGFNGSARGDVVVRDAQAQLCGLINSGQLPGGEILKIDGPCSVPVCYVIAHGLCHLYGVIAVNNLSIGYVVVISTNPAYPVGTRLNNPNFVSPPPKEPSFFIKLTGDTLKIGFNTNITAQGDQLVLDVEKALNELINSGVAKGKLLKISGHASVLVSYLIAAKLGHLYGAVAIFDPKIGDEFVDEYIFTISHDPDYRVGETIAVPTKQVSKAKVVLCGPANTGKTCLREGLKQAINQDQQTPSDFYVISGCPDGDASWYHAVSVNNPQGAQLLKQEYKRKFTPEFAQDKARDIKVIKNSLLLFDVGGKISPENELIMGSATHAVILAKNTEEAIAWEEFCQRLKLQVVAIIYTLKSDHPVEEEICQEFPLIAKTKYFQRGEDLTQRLVVQNLAKLLINLSITM